MQAEHEGVAYALQVVDLRPDAACSIIDTDVEAEVAPSAGEGLYSAQIHRHALLSRAPVLACFDVPAVVAVCCPLVPSVKEW